MKKFTQYIKESTEEENVGDCQAEIEEMIDATIENIGGDFETFIESFKKNPEDFKIEGLINDSDVYEFYLKWRNDIDELLNNVNYFDVAPSENNAFGLYDYVIKGVEKAIIESVENIN